MVERLQTLLTQLKGVLAGMTASQRLTFGVGAVLILISTSILITFATKTNYELLANVSFLEPEERRIIEQMLIDEGADWHIQGESLMVEDGMRSKLFMRLNLEEKMPNSRKAFEWLFQETPLTASTPTATKEKLRLSQAMELESVINAFEWVNSSKVIITRGNDLDPLKERRFPTRASVQVKSRNRSKTLDSEDVSAVRSMVVFAIPKIKQENVGIVIDGKPFIFETQDEDIKIADEWTQRKIHLERMIENKFKAYFLGENGEDALFKRLRVAVNISLNREIIREHVKTTREDTNPVRIMTHSNETIGKGPGVDEVGVFSETSTTENHLAAEGATQFTNRESQNNQEFLPGIEEKIVRGEIPGAIKGITVALDFDINELMRPTSLDIAKEVDPETILQREITANKARAARVIGLTDVQTPNILVSAAQFAWEDIPTPPKVTEVLLGVLEKSGGQFLVFGLSLFGFLYFVNVLRQAFETPELEEEMDEEEIARRTSEEDVARMLDAQVQDVTDIRAKQIEERVKKLVSDNPEEAGNLIKRWLLDDEQNA